MRQIKETITVTVYGRDGRGEFDLTQEAPGKFEVCPECDGRGERALHGIAITGDEWNGPDWDDDSREAYVRGDYDTVCECCNGARVIVVLDRERATPEQVAAYDGEQEAEADYRAWCAAERRLGA